jgi:hypothetical protein
MNPNHFTYKIKGKPIGFKFGLGFLSRLLEGSGIHASKIGDAIEENPFKVLPVMMYEAHKYNEERAKREFNLTVDDIIDWIDEDGGFNGGLLPSFVEAWKNSMGKDVPDARPEDIETAKKKEMKMTKITSN